ncbi:GDP-mannose 4,6-dehydratase [Cytophagaceae bacterium ABcell3]|nr:GDP-mannose 4,6-dehydratase [Cytophagaceae bacterium ABcell3]
MFSDNKIYNNSNVHITGLLEWLRPGEHERVEKLVEDCKRLGIEHLRTGFSWADWYTEGGKEWYDWLIPFLSKNLEVLPCFLYTPPSIGLAPKVSAPPKEPKSYADFLDIIITRYDQHFEWVELWNEPNNKVEYDYTLDLNWKRFSQMINMAAYWMKQRGRKTLLGGMSPIDPNWLHNMFSQGAMEHIDAVGIHGFPEVFDQHWDGWEKNINAIRETLNHHGHKAEIWITEAGFSTWQHDELKQLEEFKKAQKAPADRLYWYAAYDLDPKHPTVGGMHLDEREYHFGLKKCDGTPKLLYRMIEQKGIGLKEKMPYLKKASQNDKEKYALICGGAGFIGTNLAKSLVENGQKVMILDNVSRPGVEKNLKWLYDQYGVNIEIETGDIRNQHVVKKLVNHASEIYHFAAQVAVTTSLYNPVNDFEINARGTLNILEAIRTTAAPIPLIFTSTNKVYGSLKDIQFVEKDHRYMPQSTDLCNTGIAENRPLDFHSPYGCSKGAADQYVLDYARTYGIPATVFRMSCVYGPHQYGNEDQGWVAHFLIKALEKETISIYGNGKQVRDVLFVQDLIKAFELASRNIEKLSGQAYNIGGGIENTTSLVELIHSIGKLTGETPKVEFAPARTGDQLYYVSDIRKFSEATGWRPENSINKGLHNLLVWVCKQKGIELSSFKNIKKEATIDTFQ